MSENQTDPKGHIPTTLDKWLLVRYKKYASKEQIPNIVSSIMMRRVHDRARIHFATLLMVLSGLGMFTNVLIGKYQVKHGHSIEKAHKEYQQEYNLKKEKELEKMKNLK